MTIAWGKPKIEFAISDGTEPANWSLMPTQEEGSVQLTSERAQAFELRGENGQIIARKGGKVTYSLSMDVFIASGDTYPIPTNDGIVEDYYAVKLTPENENTTGYKFLSTQVEAEETWSSERGTMVKYTFTVS